MDIQEKARSLYGDRTKDANDPVPFAASHRWFEYFKSCHAFHNLKLTGEAAAADHAATEQFPGIFKLVRMEVTHQARCLTSMKLDYIGNTCPATL